MYNDPGKVRVLSGDLSMININVVISALGFEIVKNY